MYDIIEEDGFQNRYSEIFKNNNFFDVTIQLKYEIEGKENNLCIQCHKILLIYSSKFFKELFDKNPGQLLVIEEPNITLFKVMIEYIYTRKIDFSVFKTTDIVSLILLSKKYMIYEFAEYLGTAIFQQNNQDICCIKCLVNYFNVAIEQNVQCLIDSCLKIIRLHAGSLFCHGAFLSLSSKAMETILNEDDLNISEMELYSTVLNWAECKYFQNKNFNIVQKVRNSEIPFNIRWIENKISNILKVEDLDSKCLGKSLELHNIYKDACYNNQLNLFHMENNIDDFWIKIRNILDESNITKHIRFLALDPNEFFHRFSNSNILTVSELSEILIIQNSTNNSLQPPPGLSNIRKPRKAYNSAIKRSSSNLRIHASIFFDFISTHVFNIEYSSHQLSESFVIVSEHPIMLMSIIIPSKEKKQATGNRYEEDILIHFFKKMQLKMKPCLFASAIYQGRRKYKENLSLMLKYNINLDSDAFLTKGTEITVEIFKLSKGIYVGGLARTSLNQQSQFIVTKDKVQKGIIAGFGFCFDIGES